MDTNSGKREGKGVEGRPAHEHSHDVPIVNVVEDKGIEREIEKEEVLLEVDEADSLFGKRAGVKDGSGRY
jgi:hypothetical protein